MQNGGSESFGIPLGFLFPKSNPKAVQYFSDCRAEKDKSLKTQILVYKF